MGGVRCYRLWFTIQLLRPSGQQCKQFELLEFISESVYVDLQYDEISLTFTAGPVCLCGVSSPVVVLGLSVRLSKYPMLCVLLLR